MPKKTTNLTLAAKDGQRATPGSTPDGHVSTAAASVLHKHQADIFLAHSLMDCALSKVRSDIESSFVENSIADTIGKAMELIYEAGCGLSASDLHRAAEAHQANESGGAA